MRLGPVVWLDVRRGASAPPGIPGVVADDERAESVVLDGGGSAFAVVVVQLGRVGVVAVPRLPGTDISSGHERIKRLTLLGGGARTGAVVHGWLSLTWQGH